MGRTWGGHGGIRPEPDIRTARRSLHGGCGGFQHRRRGLTAAGGAGATKVFLWAVGDEARRAGPIRCLGASADRSMRGTVVGVEGEDDDRRVSVSFPGRGTKKLLKR